MSKLDKSCQELQVHDAVMLEFQSDNYIGDNFDKSASIKIIVKDRKYISVGGNSDILALIEKTFMSCWTLKSGFILHKAMLINAWEHRISRENW